MKKSCFLLMAFFSLCFARQIFAQNGIVDAQGEKVRVRDEKKEIPPLLQGIWQGTDRLILFADSDSEKSAEFAVVLRVFYGWYDERTSEASGYKEIKARDRNDATSKEAEDISITYRTIFENSSRSAGAYELIVKYPSIKETVSIPICVIGGKIYLDFLIKGTASATDFFDSAEYKQSSDNGGLYRAASNADGITVSSPRFKKEVTSYFVHEDNFYQIRYWESDMEYTYAKATFSDGDETFTVDKYLRVGDKIYQCTTGRSSKIRNIKKAVSNLGKAAHDDENTIFALGKEYLVKVPNGQKHENLQEIIDENNKRRKDPPKPLFPPSEIDFHWKEIAELEKYNPYTWNRRNIDLGK